MNTRCFKQYHIAERNRHCTYLKFINLYFSVTGFFFNRNPEVCYDHIGCFSNVAPYDNANGRIPESPDHIQTEILLYTRQNPTEEFLLNAYDVSNISHSHFDGSKKTVFIIHGYNDYATSDLIQDIKYELLIKVSYVTHITAEYLECVGNGNIFG